MVFYFILGSISGIILMGVAVFSKIIQYRKELMLLKKSAEHLESLNAELQLQSYEHIKNQQPLTKTKIVAIA